MTDFTRRRADGWACRRKVLSNIFPHGSAGRRAERATASGRRQSRRLEGTTRRRRAFVRRRSRGVQEGCFKIRVQEDSSLVGFTARCEPAQVYPGEYLVHLLKSKGTSIAPAILRFVGADPAGRDVHVALPSFGKSAALLRLLARVEAVGV